MQREKKRNDLEALTKTKGNVLLERTDTGLGINKIYSYSLIPYGTSVLNTTIKFLFVENRALSNRRARQLRICFRIKFLTLEINDFSNTNRHYYGKQ